MINMGVIMAAEKKSGIITKCLGGLYTVESPDGVFECKARGVFRNKKIVPFDTISPLILRIILILKMLKLKKGI